MHQYSERGGGGGCSLKYLSSCSFAEFVCTTVGLDLD